MPAAGEQWVWVVSERLLPNADVGGGVAYSVGWWLPVSPLAVRPDPCLQQEPTTSCSPAARLLPTELLCVFPAGPGVRTGRGSRVRRAGLVAGHGRASGGAPSARLRRLQTKRAYAATGRD